MRVRSATIYVHHHDLENMGVTAKIDSSKIKLPSGYEEEWLAKGCFVSRFAAQYWVPKFWDAVRDAETKANQNEFLFLEAGNGTTQVSCNWPIPSSLRILGLTNNRKHGRETDIDPGSCEDTALLSLNAYAEMFNKRMLLRAPPEIIYACHRTSKN